MDIKIIIRRFFLPSILITLYCLVKFKSFVSFRAEIELSENFSIGRGTNIGSFTKIKASDGPLQIGDNVQISSGCDISSGTQGIAIGNDCMISAHVNIIGNNYRYDRLDIPVRLQEKISKGIKIGNDVWIGAGCCILDGSEIGDGVIITPNSVVSGKIKTNNIASGNPAKAIFERRA
jgi:acetyltransferase-like isoleucine patch superfamily enzyme